MWGKTTTTTLKSIWSVFSIHQIDAARARSKSFKDSIFYLTFHSNQLTVTTWIVNLVIEIYMKKATIRMEVTNFHLLETALNDTTQNLMACIKSGPKIGLLPSPYRQSLPFDGQSRGRRWPQNDKSDSSHWWPFKTARQRSLTLSIRKLVKHKSKCDSYH